MEIKVGNITKTIPNNLYANLNLDSIDPDYLYAEIYGSYPIYSCSYSLDESVDDETDCYTEVFNDLQKSGEFEVMMYRYNYTNNPNKKSSIDNIIAEKYLLFHKEKPVAIYYSYDGIYVISHTGTEVITDVIENTLKKYVKTSDAVKCHIIMREHGTYLSDFTIPLKGDLDFGLYNEGFEDVHKDIVKSIKEDNNGLYLLYGKPGTGKTTYIRHLIKECGTDERKFVYVPSNLFGEFTNPSFLPFLIENKGCVFIIEDCESLVTTIDGIRNDVITDLLNMTDGLLADALNIKIICTFNIDDGQIDEALLRPGRCRCKYEFNLLKKDRANEVAERLGLEKVNKDVSLADLFNSGKSFVEEKKKMGFC